MHGEYLAQCSGHDKYKLKSSCDHDEDEDEEEEEEENEQMGEGYELALESGHGNRTPSLWKEAARTSLCVLLFRADA